MSDRTVKVTLTLDAAQYRSALKAASKDTANLTASGDRAAISVKSLFKAAAGSTAVLGIAKLAKDSVQLEAAYSRTMRQIAAQTNAPKKQLAELDDLAMKLGADTVFSAQDAASAMLELAKGGLKPAQIEAGALKDSLTLASAGGLDLDIAANSVVNTMGAFKLSAKETTTAVAALAGAANASSANVSDITQALAQAGTEAHAAGLSVQETTAILAAFSNAGIQGSDAGTSLKTMLSRLVPQTDDQVAEMRRLHLSFVNANGEFVSATQIAEKLRTTYKDMSAEERSTSLNTLFGSDARRAANILIGEGAAGIKDYIRQTSDLRAAEKLSAASMSGTSGAIEQLSGAIDTAKIQIGKGLAPVIEDVANNAANMIGDVNLEQWAHDAAQGFVDFGTEVAPLVTSLADLGQNALPAVATAGETTVDVLKTAADVVTPLVEAFNSLPESAQKALILAAGAKTLSSRLGPAGTDLLVFGGRAKGAGTEVGGVTSRVSGLVGSLKGFAALSAAAYLVDLSSEAHDTNAALGVLNDTAAGAAAGFAVGGPLGAGIGATAGLLKSLSDEINATTEGFDGMMADLQPAIDKAVAIRKAQAEAEQKSWLIQAFGLEKYHDELMRLPDQVLTRIVTPGAIESFEDITALVKKYDLTPDLVEMLIKTSGVPLTKKQQREILELADRIDKKKSEAKIRANTAQARAALQEILGLLGGVSDREARITIKRSYTDTSNDTPANGRQPTTGDLFFGGPLPPAKKGKGTKRYTGGTVPYGYADGGRVPGMPPVDPTADNVLAVSSLGNPLMVRSGEWIINEPQSRKNDKWLGAINAGLDLNEVLGPFKDTVRGYASGGRADRAVTPLELVQMKQRVRDLQRDLASTELAGRGRNRRRRPRLRGLDREAARLELLDAREELVSAQRGNANARRAGLRRDQYNARLDERAQAREDARDAKKQAAADLKAARADASSSLLGNASLEGLQTPAQVQRYLAQQIVRFATFTKLLIDLKKKGAAPWLLEQLQALGPSDGTIRLAQQYATDSAALRSVNAQIGQLTGVTNTYGKVTGSPQWTTSKAWNPTLSSTESRSLNVNVSALDTSTVAREVTRYLSHELGSLALSGGV